MSRSLINKERDGLTIKTTVRIPTEDYKWLKMKSENTRNGGKGNYKSMNDFIVDAIKEFIQK